MAIDRLAVYTVAHPGVSPYLAQWYRSVLAQTDNDFDLWVSVDSLSPEEFVDALEVEPSALNILVARDLSPAQLRQEAIQMLVEDYSAIIFVDSDDLLYPTRVESARTALQSHDLVGCALRIINEEGHELGIVFAPAVEENIESLLPRYNIFGLSNTAYRSATLRQCLPIPADCVCIDWLLATRAWAIGADLHFDRVPEMAYRQYSANTARVLLPFTTEQIVKSAERVLNHYHCVLSNGWELPVAHKSIIETAGDRAESFHRAMTESPSTLNRYVEALNEMDPQYIWWWCVAHPNLEEIWKN